MRRGTPARLCRVCGIYGADPGPWRRYAIPFRHFSLGRGEGVPETPNHARSEGGAGSKTHVPGASQISKKGVFRLVDRAEKNPLRSRVRRFESYWGRFFSPGHMAAELALCRIASLTGMQPDVARCGSTSGFPEHIRNGYESSGRDTIAAYVLQDRHVWRGDKRRRRHLVTGCCAGALGWARPSIPPRSDGCCRSWATKHLPLPVVCGTRVSWCRTEGCGCRVTC